MASTFLHSLVASLVLYLSSLLIVVIVNLRSLPRLEQTASNLPHRPDGNLPRVSILLPARNEEANIRSCVTSLLAQDYPDFEVMVLDDGSEDLTGPILAGLTNAYDRLRVLPGKPLPLGWLGKLWACHQLAAAASGELLLFTDADTVHHPETLREAIAVMVEEGLDFLTIWPRQEAVTWGEKLVIPLIYWSVFAFLPITLAYCIRWPALSAAIGQFMLFRAPAYQKVGGHAAVRDNAADDLALARQVKVQGLGWRMLDGGSRIRCRMYRGFQDAFRGLSKSLFSAFDHRILPFALVWIWVGLVFLMPLSVLIQKISGLPVSNPALLLSVVAVIQAMIVWGLTGWRFRFPSALMLLYPLSVAFALAIALRSLVLTLQGRSTWKERVMTKPAIRWL